MAKECKDGVEPYDRAGFEEGEYESRIRYENMIRKRRNLQEEMTVEDVGKDAKETVIYISSDSDDE